MEAVHSMTSMVIKASHRTGPKDQTPPWNWRKISECIQSSYLCVPFTIFFSYNSSWILRGCGSATFLWEDPLQWLTVSRGLPGCNQSCSSKTSNEVVVVGEIAASPPTHACLSAIIQPSLLLYIILGGLHTETNEGRKEIDGRSRGEKTSPNLKIKYPGCGIKQFYSWTMNHYGYQVSWLRRRKISPEETHTKPVQR